MIVAPSEALATLASEGIADGKAIHLAFALRATILDIRIHTAGFIACHAPRSRGHAFSLVVHPL